MAKTLQLFVLPLCQIYRSTCQDRDPSNSSTLNGRMVRCCLLKDAVPRHIDVSNRLSVMAFHVEHSLQRLLLFYLLTRLSSSTNSIAAYQNARKSDSENLRFWYKMNPPPIPRTPSTIDQFRTQ
ncbi:hypothetical protein ABVK25_011828 [Lepraria finkii]|uniref:Uncharacterized protein n=1 Tax=Lepraria finkii TaxID=1340010 RepID=A0ABR4ASQ4_9LECA